MWFTVKVAFFEACADSSSDEPAIRSVNVANAKRIVFVLFTYGSLYE